MDIYRYGRQTLYLIGFNHDKLMRFRIGEIVIPHK